MVFFSIIFFEHDCGEDCEVHDLSLPERPVRQDEVLSLLLIALDCKQPPGMSTIKRNQMTQRCEYVYSST